MDNQERQNSVAKIAEALITTQRNLVTVSRSLWAVRISIRELHPDFEEMYLNHFAEPEHAFDTMRDKRPSKVNLPSSKPVPILMVFFTVP